MSKFIEWVKSAYKLYTAHAGEIQAIASAVQSIYGEEAKKETPRAAMSPAEARALVLTLGLERSAQWDLLTDSELEAICNGFGPDAWPGPLRDVATWWYRNLQPVDKIHDVEYQFSDGTAKGWRAADARFARNGSKVLSYRYPLARVAQWPERIALWAKLRLANRLLAIGGYEAWCAAYDRRKAK